jgi:hypothetical protein
MRLQAFLGDEVTAYRQQALEIMLKLEETKHANPADGIPAFQGIHTVPKDLGHLSQSPHQRTLPSRLGRVFSFE